MDRDDSDNGSSKDLSSFDVAKMSEAEVAAEIAQRMTRWRRARNRAEQTEPAPRADRPAASQAVAVPSDAAAVAGPVASALPDTDAARMARALRLAAGKAEARRLPAADTPAEGPEVAAQPEPESRTEQFVSRPHAIARLARRAPVRWAVMAAAVVAAGATVVSIFLPLGQGPPPQVAPKAEAPPADAGASALRTPAPEARALQQAPPATATAPLQTSLATLLPARIKPASKLPTLAARLKPDGTAATKPNPAPAAQPESAPPPSAAQAPPTRAEPRAEPQYKPAPPAARGTGEDDDLNDLFEQMFGDGVGQ